MPEARTEWARLGAMTRLQQIDQERQAILRAFPDLLRKRSRAVSSNGHPKPRRKMSAAARRRMSQGMKKFWAKRRGTTRKVS